MSFREKFDKDNSVFLCFWIFAFICEFGIASDQLSQNNRTLNLTNEEWNLLGKHLRDIFSKNFKLKFNTFDDDINTSEFNINKLKKRLDKELYEATAKKGNLSERSFIYYPIHKSRAPYISFLFRPKIGANNASDPYPFHIKPTKTIEEKKYKQINENAISHIKGGEEFYTHKNINQILNNIDPLDDADGNNGRPYKKYKSKNEKTILDDISEGERYKEYGDIIKNTQSVDLLGPATVYRYDRRPPSRDHFFRIRDSTFENRININNMTNTVEAVNGLIHEQLREKQKNIFPSKNYFSIDKKVSIKHPAKYIMNVEQVIPTQINYPNSKVGFQKKRKLNQHANNPLPNNHPIFRPDQSKNYHNIGYVKNSFPLSNNNYVYKDEFGLKALDKTTDIYNSETGQLTPDANALINMHNIQGLPLHNNKNNQLDSDAKKYTIVNSFVNSEYRRPLYEYSTRTYQDKKRNYDEKIQYANLVQTIAEMENLQDDSDIIKSAKENIDKNYLQTIYRQVRSNSVKASRFGSGYLHPKCKDILY